MSEKVDIWMPLYVKDYLAATSRLTTEQHGAYLLLIMDYWLNGPPPDDDAVLSSIVHLSLDRWTKHRPSIERLFKVASGEWRHTRIEKEISAARDRRKQAIERGKKGAAARWQSKDIASIDQAKPKHSSKDGSAPAPAPAQPSTPKPAVKGEGAPNGASPPKQKRGCRIPEDFPDDDALIWATENFPMIDHNQEAAKFRDYWLSVAGQKGVKLDWMATWRGWIRRALEFQQERKPAGDKSDQAVEAFVNG